MRNRLGLMAVAAVAAIAFAAPANATAIAFNGTSGGSGSLDVSFSGIFQATMTGVNTWLVNSISGTQTQGGNTVAITGLSSYAAADQQLFGPITALMPDLSGISWVTSLGDFNWFTNGSQYELASTTDSVGYPANGVLLTSSGANGVPEPATLALLGAGLIGAGFMGRKKCQAGGAATA